MQRMQNPPARPMPAWRSPWVQAWIGLVATVLAVNLLMVWLAFATSPGLVNPDYYERGQAYERTLVSRAARDPGWIPHADVPTPLIAGVPETIRFLAVDRAGQPVDLAEVTLHAYRPSDSARDFALPMIREDRGRYAVTTAFPLIGVWDLLIVAQDAASGDGAEFSHGMRVSVRRP